MKLGERARETPKMRDKQYKILDEWMNVERLRLIYLYDCADADRGTHAEGER